VVRLPLLGAHQRGNLGLAWAAMEALGEAGFEVSSEDFVRGVEGLLWPGRLEVVRARPWLVLDCAHNVPSLQALAAALPEALRYERLVLVLGMSADKEVVAAAACIAPRADRVILTQAMMQRALWASKLTEATWHLWRSTPLVRWTVAEALAEAEALARPEDCICVTGSVFVVGEAMEVLGLPVR
jgi:dihydrofolate synthase / folylpolyglutamate synthase